jgi:hypothetical protein
MANETLAQLTETWGTPLLVADIPADLVPEGIYLPDKIAIFPLDRKKFGGCIVFANNTSASDPDKDQWTANCGERIAIRLLLDRLAVGSADTAGSGVSAEQPNQAPPITP